MQFLTRYAFIVFGVTTLVCLYRHWYIAAFIFMLLTAFKLVDDLYPDFHETRE